jgi:hypothetical protein
MCIYAGNNPIKYIDLDGAERLDPSDNIFYNHGAYIDMTSAPGTKVNAAGFPRNGPWFWRRMLYDHPEMFSPNNVANIKRSKSPIVDEQWIIYNPSHAPY